MATDTPNGFKPIRHLNGGGAGCFTTRLFQKTAAEELFIGDPVKLVAAGTVSRLQPATAAATPADRSCVGIVAGVASNSDGKPKTFATSGKSTWSPGGATDWIYVWVDPDIIYEVVANASAGQSDIGRTASVTAHAANSAVGRSGYGLDDAEASAAVAGEGSTFRIVGISTRNTGVVGNVGDPAGKVEVIINNHAFRNPLTI